MPKTGHVITIVFFSLLAGIIAGASSPEKFGTFCLVFIFSFLILVTAVHASDKPSKEAKSPLLSGQLDHNHKLPAGVKIDYQGAQRQPCISKDRIGIFHINFGNALIQIDKNKVSFDRCENEFSAVVQTKSGIFSYNQGENMNPKIVYYWADGRHLCAQRSDMANQLLFIDQSKSNQVKKLFFITDGYRHGHTLTLYPGVVSADLQETVDKYFNILDCGGILYTESQDGTLNPRATSDIMINRREYILRLQNGVESTWVGWRSNPQLADTLEYLLKNIKN